MIKKYEILEHPADIGIKAYGTDLKMAFERAAEGLYSLMVNSTNQSADIKKQINIESKDLESLLIKWLNEILYFFEVDEFISNTIKILDLKYNNESAMLLAELGGFKFDRNRDKFLTGVKAVTFHQMEIIKGNDESSIQVFFDI